MDSTKVALMLVVLMTVGCVLNVTAQLNVDNYDGMMMESQGSPLRSAYNYDLDVAEHKKKKYRGYSRGYGHGGGGGGSSEERR
ncbi:hypothetical protein GHT06_022082 [Daphnia sinensis]|uniref:Uncharacterized protein n=1 Tax=Daphnia sinensis TaxID=1820382 RepID=A0AAD5PLB8_9CRUS|nr:hypothetical protein GHT06_022082 [Daphnia sinensis]